MSEVNESLPVKSTQERIYGNVNNPYSQVGAPPKQSWFRDVLGWLGLGKTNAERMYDYQLSQSQWQSQFDTSQADIEYNNPRNQASLMRQAGINPDLNGLSNFEAASGENPANSPTDLTPVQGGLEHLASAISNGLQMFIGVRKGLIEVSDMNIENKTKRRDFIEKSAEGILRNVIRDTDRTDVRHGNNVVESTPYGPYLNNIKSRRLRKEVESYLNDIWYGGLQERYSYEEDTKNAKARNDYLESSSSYFDKDDLSVIKVLREANDLRIKANNKANELGVADALFGIDYSNWSRANKTYQTEFSLNTKGKNFQNKLLEYQNYTQELQNNFYKKLNNDPTGIGQFILFNILNSTGSSMLGDLLNGAMRAVPQTRYFHHLGH